MSGVEKLPDQTKLSETQEGVIKKAETQAVTPAQKAKDAAEHKKKVTAQRQADQAKIQEIRESLGFFEMKPVIGERYASEAIQEVMLNDLHSGNEHGPYTQMRKKISETYGFDYDSLASQVHTALEQGKDPAEIENFAKEQLQKLTGKIWEDRKADLEQWSGLLRDTLGENRESILSIRKNLEKFYGVDFRSETFNLILAPHPQDKENLAIPSNEEPGELTLFVPRIEGIASEKRQAAAEDLIVDSFHEMSHQQLQTEIFTELLESAKQTDEYKQVLDMYCEGQEPFYNFTKEAVTNYIDAYVRQSQFHREQTTTPEHARNVYVMASWINTELADEYFSKEKQIDLEFVKRLFKLMQE